MKKFLDSYLLYTRWVGISQKNHFTLLSLQRSHLIAPLVIATDPSTTYNYSKHASSNGMLSKRIGHLYSDVYVNRKVKSTLESTGTQ
jgi:hypothetical protein